MSANSEHKSTGKVSGCGLESGSMATEADVPEAISIAEGVERSLKIEKLDTTDDGCSPGTLNGSKGDLDQHPEIHIDKPFGGNVQVECSMKVEKNNSIGISEGEHFLDPLSEISQDEQSNQAGMETPENEVQLQKGTQVGGPVEETVTEENEVIEERKEKLAQEFEKHDTVIGEGIISEITKTGDANLEAEEVEASTNETNVDQVISKQQDSIEDVKCVEKEADIKGADKADGNAKSYHKEASDLLEPTTFQEYEASVNTPDVINRGFKKDNELETNVTSTDEEDSQQTMQTYEPREEEVQKLPEVTPEGAKPESKVAEVITSTEEERTIQNTPQYAEKEDAIPVHCPKQDDTITEEVSMATSTEQETAEHALPEIHAAENHPQEFREEKSIDDQASVEAANLSTDTDEKNLEEQAIQEKSSSLVEEETTQQISREEEVHTTNLKEEKEAYTKCKEPIEVADTTREIEFETIEQRSETNKDLYVPIPEEEAYAEESTKALVEDNSFPSEVSEVKSKEIIQEDHPTLSDYDLVSGEVSQVSALEESEAENKEHANSTPEEEGLQTILTAETVVRTADHAEAGENYNSEMMDKEIQTKEDEGERDSKKIKDDKKEPVDNAGIAPAEGLATISTDQPALHIEDIELQAEENVTSKDKLEEEIQTAVDDGENGLIQAQTDNYEQVKDTDIASEEKDPEITLTDETTLDSKDIDVQAEKVSSLEENLEKQAQVVADEDDIGLKEAEEEVKITDSNPEEKVTILKEEKALDSEKTELQVEECVSSKDYLEEPTVEECEAGLKELKEESKEPASINDISPEEKGLATILTDEITQEAAGIDVTTREYINSKDIEGEISCLADSQEENKDKVTYTDISSEEKIVNSQEELEQVPVVEYEGDTSLNEAEEEIKEQIKSKDTCPEEKALPIISTDETTLNSDEIDSQLKEDINSTDNLEKKIRTGVEEPEPSLVEAKEENKEQVANTDITYEVKSVPTILKDQTALESEEIELYAEENVDSTDYLEKQIQTAEDEGEDNLTEAEAKSKEQVIITDITPEEEGAASILTDERSLETDDTNVLAEESGNPNEHLEEILAAPELGDSCFKKEDEVDNKEQVESNDSSHEERGLATILTEETSQEIEYSDKKGGIFNSEDILEKQIPTAVHEGETDLKKVSKEVEADCKEQVETTERAPEENSSATILIDETAEGVELINAPVEEINSKEVLEKQILTASVEGETDLKEAEADIKEQVETTYINPEKKDAETILSDERAVDLDDIHVQEQDNFNCENLGCQIPTSLGEGETDSIEGEAENKAQVKSTDIAAEEKGTTTILKDETAVAIQDVDVQAEEKPEEASECEENVVTLNDIPADVHNTELLEEATVGQSYQVPSHEEAEPKIAVEDEKSEDHPERNHMIVEEVLDEPKITSPDLIEEQIIEGNVKSSILELIEEDAIKSSKDNETETIELKKEGSCTENTKEENASDLTREYTPEDATEQIKDEGYNAVKSENENLENLRTAEVDEGTTCETKNAETSEETLSTLPVEYDEVHQGEGSSPGPTEALKEENIIEDILSVQVAKDVGDNVAATITERSAEVEDSSELSQKYEPEEEITKFPDVKPEETTTEPSSEIVEVTCTKKEIQESLDTEMDTKQSDPSSAEALKTAITEALPEVYPIDNTAETTTEYQARIEGAVLSTEGEKENSEEQTIQEVTSSLIADESEESSKEQEEKSGGHLECEDSIEEAKSETLEETTEPKPTSEEESKKSIVEDNSLPLETSEKEIEKEIQGEYSSTVRIFYSEVVRDQTGWTEDKEQVETTQIAPEEKDNEGIDVYKTALTGETIVEPSSQVQTLEEEAAEKLEVEDEADKSDDLAENNNKNCEKVLEEPKITDRDFNEEQLTEGNVTNLTTEPVEEQETVEDYQGEEKLNEEESCIENVHEGNANDISTESAPEDKDGKLKDYIEETVESKEQITEGNVKTYTPESIEEDTVQNSQDFENETVELREVETCTESRQEENASELSPKCRVDQMKSEEISQTIGVDESSTCETVNVQRSEEDLGTLPVVQLLLQKQMQDNVDEDTYTVQETKDGDDGAVTVTETSAEVPLIDEDGSTLVLQKSEPEDRLTESRDVMPEEMKPKLSSENAEVVTCTKEEPQESLDIQKDTKESDSSNGEVCTEAAKLSIEGEKEEQTKEEASFSPVGEETTEESSKEEEKNEAHERCKEAVEGTQEESNKALVKEGSISLDALDEMIEEIQGQYSSIIRDFDSEIESDERGLTEPTEQLEATNIAPEEKDTEGTDVCNTKLVEEAIVETSPPVQSQEEEAQPILKVEDDPEKSDDHPEKSDKICEEVLDEPKIINRDVEQITEESIASCASEPVEEETVEDDQADQKERASSNEGISIENIKEDDVSDISTECVPEVIVEECTREAVESKEEILQETQDDRDEETLSVKEAGDNDDNNGTVVLPEACEEVTSIGEESSEVTQIVKLKEEEAQVENSDVADEIEVCDLEDKVSVAEMAEKETKEVEVSSLALEKLDSDAPEKETTESSEVVSDFKSIDVVAQDEAIAGQTLNEETTKEPSTLLSEEKVLRDAEDEQGKELEVPTEAHIGDLVVARSAEDTCLPKEESRELKVSELVLEKLDASETEQETEETSETVYKSDSQSTAVVCEDEVVTDQTQCEDEKELTASESVQVIQEESPKEVEMPADEDKQESFAATPSETCLRPEEPIVTESAPHKLDAGETEEEIKGTFETVTTTDSQSVIVASGDEIIADETMYEEVTNTPLSTAREMEASELSLKKLDAENTEEIKRGPEIVPKIDSGIIEVVSSEEIMRDQIQSPSSTLFPEEKEHETSERELEITAQGKNTEPDCTKEVEAAADEETQVQLAAKPVEEECLQKEEPSELYVSDSTSEFPSIVADKKEEITIDETLSKGVTYIPLEIPTYTSLNEEKEPKASELDLEKLDADIPEEVKGSEVIPQSVSQSSGEVSKDEIIADQREIPSSALPPDEKELKASEHEHETIIDGNNQEDENLKEVKEPTDEASEYVFVARSVQEACLQKEDPSELEVPEANETEEVKETFETVSESDSQSINAVSKHDSIADQTLSDKITDMPLDIPSYYTSNLKENEEVKEDATELALERLEADGTVEDKNSSEVTPKSDLQSIDVVIKDEIITDQVLHEGITEEQLLIQSSTLLQEEKELKETVHEHETETCDKNLEEECPKETEVTADGYTRDVVVPSSEAKAQLHKEEAGELKVSELSPESEGTEGEKDITETFESTDAVSGEDTIAVQTLHQHAEQLQIASPALLPKEKEEATVHKEELQNSQVLELSLKGETEEETKEAFETAPQVSSESIGELATDEIVDQIPPSSLISEEKSCDNTTTIINTRDESMNVVELETPNDESRKETNSAEEQETEETSETVYKSDSQSTAIVCEDEVVTDQTQCEGEKELRASESVQVIEEESPKEVEMPADEDNQESFAATPSETCLRPEEPIVTESAPHKLDAGETEEEIKGTFKTVTTTDSQSVIVASGDEIIADETMYEEVTNTPLSTAREMEASELALEKLDAEDTEEIKGGPEIVPKIDSGIIEVVSSEEIMRDQIQSPSSTLFPEEKEHETSERELEITAQGKSTEPDCTKEVEAAADEETQVQLAAKPVEEECLQKKSELYVSDSTSEFPSIVADKKEEITVDETLSKGVTDIPLETPSYTSLNEEKEPKASELDLEKLDADIPEEVKGSEVMPQSVYQSSGEVSKDEKIADQREIPSSALPPDEKELEASEHEHETIIDGNNQEDENLKEVKEPTDEASEYVFVARSVQETCLQKEEPSELEVPEANETEEVKETFETVSESDSQSINAVSKHDSIADQTLSDKITDMPLDIPSYYTSNLKENEEVKEDATELALEKLAADGTVEDKNSSEVTPKSDLQSIDVVIKDEIITDQVLHEGITEEQLLTQSSTLLPEEKELKETVHEHETETHDKNLEDCPKETEVTADGYNRDVVVPSSEAKEQLHKEEAGELKVSELSPESECTEGEKDITATFESTDAVSKEDTIAVQTLHQHAEQLQIASPALLPKEKEEATVHKEELQNSQVLELSLKGETEEETKEAFETAPQVSLESIDEHATNEIVDQIPPSSLISEEKSCDNTTTIINTRDERMNVVELETSNDENRKETNSAEEQQPSILNVSDLEFPSSQYTERASSNEEKNLEVATSDSKAEDSCETTIEANQTTKIEVQNEEIKDEKEVANDSQLISVGEEYVKESQRQYESTEEKHSEEKNDTFTAPTVHHEVPEVDEIGSLSRDYEKEVKQDNKGSKDHIPDEAEGMIQETAIHLGLADQGDGISCESSATEVTYPVEKDSSVEISRGVLGVEEANGTTQDNKQLDKDSHATDIPSCKDEALNFVQAPKLEDTKPSNDILVARETKEQFCESGTETVDSTSVQISSSERLTEESTKERGKVVTHLTEEKEPIVGKEQQVNEAEEEEEHENVEETKTDEEKEDTEHKRAYQGYDEPVIVEEASRDNEVKVSPKKSHNILSGMGKSVKHSISKVKKAIIGKSSNSKTQSEK